MRDQRVSVFLLAVLLWVLTACAPQRSVLQASPPTAGSQAVATDAAGPSQQEPETVAGAGAGEPAAPPPAAAALEEGDDGVEDLWEEEEALVVPDPLEPVNRALFWVNDKLYVYLFKPIVRVYRVVPEPARRSVSNFFTNLKTPLRFANCLLQLKFLDATNELGRFLANSTLGVGGLFDIAKLDGGPGPKAEDFGQTLGRYGAGQGFYLVLPLLGPSSLRDGIGTVGDWYLDPLTYVLKFEERIGVTVADKGTALSLDKDTYEAIKKEQLDPYVFIRNAYFQYRAEQVRQ
ncbi:MAG: VacJ family lipoprotein [Deferrisomatales bacterium]|nr:VacJ family lipoprotein [Deferrisomatales bacterium]